MPQANAEGQLDWASNLQFALSMANGKVSTFYLRVRDRLIMGKAGNNRLGAQEDKHSFSLRELENEV